MTHAWLFTGPARLRPVHRGPRLRRRAPVRQPRPRARRRPRLRLLRRLPHRPGRHARRRRGRPYGPAVHRRQGDPRPRPPRPALPGRRPLAGDRPGGRRPAHRGRGQRPPEGRRGARPPHGLAAVRALHRGRAAHHPLPLPPPHPAHARRWTPSPTCSIRRDGIEPEVAAAAARATQGHIGRARRLATDERARARRAAVLKLPAARRRHRRLPQGGPGADRRRGRGRQAGRRGGRRQGDRGAEGRARRRAGRAAGCRAARRA